MASLSLASAFPLAVKRSRVIAASIGSSEIPGVQDGETMEPSSYAWMTHKQSQCHMVHVISMSLLLGPLYETMNTFLSNYILATEK